jgi:[ribosomal protein S5]-alanine N-acetyltransferase
MFDGPSLYPVTLTGERVVLREFRSSDAGAAYRWASDSEFFRYSSLEAVTSVAEEAGFLRDIEAKAQTNPRMHYHLGIVERARNDLIGIVRLSVSAPEHRGADIGYGLRTDAWKRGYATEAACLLVDFGFTQLGLHRITAVCDPSNVASRRVLVKLGMRPEGRFRDHLLAHGEYRDSLAFAILEDEWNA